MPAPQVDEQDHDEAEHHDHARPEQRNVGIAVHPLEIDGDGDGSRDAQIVASQEQRSAKLAQCAGEGEHGARCDGRP